MIKALLSMLSKLLTSLFYKKKTYTKEDVQQSVFEEKASTVRKQIEEIEKKDTTAKDLTDAEVVKYWKE